MALLLEQTAPELDDETIATSDASQVAVNDAYQTIVYAENAFVGSSPTQVNQQITVVPGDSESLRGYLVQLQGLDSEDIVELVAAAREAREAGEAVYEPRSRIAILLSKLAGVTARAGEKALDVAVKVAIDRYMGPAS